MPVKMPKSSAAFLANDQLRNQLIETAIDRGYLEIKPRRVKYICRREYEADYTDPEEQVRAAVYAWLILERGFPSSQIDIEVSVPRRVPADRADIVIYEDPDCRNPWLVVECKPPRMSARSRSQAIEQSFGNANSFRVTQYVLYDSLDDSRLYAVQGHPHDEREKNYLGPRDALPVDFGRNPDFRLLAAGEHDIAPFPVRELETRVRRAHGVIWAGGKRDPLTAFDEWCKLLFAKIYDERNTRNGEPRSFQIGTGESYVRVGTRIRNLYKLAIKDDATIFSAPIALPDVKIFDVVRIIESIGFTLTDLDTLAVQRGSFAVP